MLVCLCKEKRYGNQNMANKPETVQVDADRKVWNARLINILEGGTIEYILIFYMKIVSEFPIYLPKNWYGRPFGVIKVLVFKDFLRSNVGISQFFSDNSLSHYAENFYRKLLWVISNFVSLWNWLYCLVVKMAFLSKQSSFVYEKSLHFRRIQVVL